MESWIGVGSTVTVRDAEIRTYVGVPVVSTRSDGIGPTIMSPDTTWRGKSLV